MALFKFQNNSDSLKIAIFGIKIKKKKKKPKLNYIEIHLADHCNLNCKACDHYCPIADEKLADINEYKKDIQELSKKIDIETIRLMGGEPLLNPDVVEFIFETRKAYPRAKISIVTNGILIPAMKEDFWSACRKNNVKIDMSKYPPMHNKFADYLDVIANNRVQIGNISVRNDFMILLNPEGNSNPVEALSACTSKGCTNLKNAKLYRCPFCWISYYNKTFRENIPEPEGINIYENSGKEIIEFLNKPVVSCSYCRFSKDTPLINWQVSNKVKEEWYQV